MTTSEMLTMLKQSIGETNASTDRNTWIEHKLNSAMSRLEENGVVFNPTDNDYPIDDSDLIVTYAEFLIRKRDTQDGLPRALEWAIHNRLMVQQTESEA